MKYEYVEKVHRRLSASTTERFWNCPGSVSLGEVAKTTYGAAPANKYAAEGTYAHLLAELELKLRLGCITDEELHIWNECSKSCEIDGFSFTRTQEVAGHVRDYCEYVLDTVERWKVSNKFCEVEKELSIPYSEELGGTADCTIFVPYNRIIVIDFKYGAGQKVEVEDNKQLLQYALGAYYSIDEDERDQIKTVELIIFQPRVYDGIQSVCYSVEELAEFYGGLKTAVNKCKFGEKGGLIPLKAGDWCRYCPAKLICKAHEAYVKQETTLELASIPLTATKLTPNFYEYTPEQISSALKARKFFDEWFNSLEIFAKGCVEAGKIEIPGFELKQSLGNREWKDEENAAAWLKKMINKAEKENWLEMEVYETKLRSPNQIEKMFKGISTEGLTERKEKGYALSQVKTNLPKAAPKDPFKEIKADNDDF